MSTQWHIFTGTFTDFFYAMTLDAETLGVSGLHKVPDPAGRSAFFALSTDGNCLYVANEYQSGAGGVAAFRLGADGEPRFLNAQESHSQGPAHISLMRAFDRDYVIGSGFFDGDILVCPTAEDGSLLPMSENFRLRTGAHAHGIRPVPGTHFVLATDTEHDRIHTYELTAGGRLIERHCFSDPMLQAPRHMTFSRDGAEVYVVTERTSCLDVFRVNRETGELTHTDHHSNLPDHCTVESRSSAIHRAPNGPYVYCANRGHDSLTVYRVDDGKAEKIGCVSDSISWPREFMIDPNGQFMLVGNQTTNSISVFSLDRETGLPVFTGQKIQLDEGPACFACLPQRS